MYWSFQHLRQNWDWLRVDTLITQFWLIDVFEIFHLLDKSKLIVEKQKTLQYFIQFQNS
jgi:hypothetical protein